MSPPLAATQRTATARNLETALFHPCMNFACHFRCRGYYPKYLQQERALVSVLPDVDSVGVVGRT